MEHLFHTAISFVESSMYLCGEIAIIVFEVIGLGIIVLAGIKGIAALSKKSVDTSLLLLKGFGLGLTFLLGGEIIKTMFAHDLNDVLALVGIVIMRVALAILVHWEKEHEQHNGVHQH